MRERVRKSRSQIAMQAARDTFMEQASGAEFAEPVKVRGRPPVTRPRTHASTHGRTDGGREGGGRREEWWETGDAVGRGGGRRVPLCTGIVTVSSEEKAMS